MIIPKIKCNSTPLLMAVIIGHFQTSNSIFLGCFNWPIMIMGKVYSLCTAEMALKPVCMIGSLE